MQHTRRLIQHARNRRRWSRSAAWLGRTWLAVAVAAAIAWTSVVALGAAWPWWIVPAALGVAGALAVISACLQRESDHDLAAHLDATLELKNKLGSALFAQTQADHPFTASVIADAERVAEDRSLRKTYAQRRALSASSGLWRWTGTALAALAVLIVFLPAGFDPLGIRERQASADQSQAQRDEHTDAAQARIESARALLEPMTQADVSDDAPADAEALLEELQAVMTRRDLGTPQGQRDAQAELSALRQRIAEQTQSQRQQQQALEQSLSGLNPQQPGPADRFAEALRRADFAEAARQFESLTTQADEGRLSETQRQQLQEQLSDLREQLEQQAQVQRDPNTPRAQPDTPTTPDAPPGTQTADGDQGQDQSADSSGGPPQPADQAEQLAQAIERVERALQEQRATAPESAPAQQQLGQLDRQQRDAQRLREAEQQLQQAQQQLAEADEPRPPPQPASTPNAAPPPAPSDATQTAEQREPREASDADTSTAQGGQPPTSPQASSNTPPPADPNAPQQSADAQAGSEPADQPSDAGSPSSSPSSSPDASQPGQTADGSTPSSSPGGSPGSTPGTTPGNASQPAASQTASSSPNGSQPASQPGNQPGNASNTPTQGGTTPSTSASGPGGRVGGTGDGGNLFGQERQDPNLGTEAVRDVQDGEGWVIASWETQGGEGQAGPATVRFRQAVTEAQDAAEQAVNDDRAPRRYHRAIKQYFDQLPATPQPDTPPNADAP